MNELDFMSVARLSILNNVGVNLIKFQQNQRLKHVKTETIKE